MKNAEQFIVQVEGGTQPVRFDSLFQVSKQYGVSVPTLTRCLQQGQVGVRVAKKLPAGFRIEKVEREIEIVDIPPKPKRTYEKWLCPVCQKEYVITSKGSHLASQRHRRMELAVQAQQVPPRCGEPSLTDGEASPPHVISKEEAVEAIRLAGEVKQPKRGRPRKSLKKVA